MFIVHSIIFLPDALHFHRCSIQQHLLHLDTISSNSTSSSVTYNSYPSERDPLRAALSCLSMSLPNLVPCRRSRWTQGVETSTASVSVYQPNSPSPVCRVYHPTALLSIFVPAIPTSGTDIMSMLHRIGSASVQIRLFAQGRHIYLDQRPFAKRYFQNILYSTSSFRMMSSLPVDNSLTDYLRSQQPPRIPRSMDPLYVKV